MTIPFTQKYTCLYLVAFDYGVPQSFSKLQLKFYTTLNFYIKTLLMNHFNRNNCSSSESLNPAQYFIIILISFCLGNPYLICMHHIVIKCLQHGPNSLLNILLIT